MALISATNGTDESKGIGLVSTNYDALEVDTWICDTGASTHMCNTDEGMFDCVTCTNQYIKVGSGQKLEINKKGKKNCIAIQKDGKKKKIVLDERISSIGHYVPLHIHLRCMMGTGKLFHLPFV